MSREESLGLELADALRRQWWVAAIVFLGFTAGAATYATRLPTTWQSSSVVAFSPRPRTAVGGDTLRVVVPRFLAYATADATLVDVAGRTGLPYATVSGAVEASIAPETANLTVVVTLQDPAAAQLVARAVTDAVVAFADDDPLVVGTVVAPPVEPTVPAGPPRRLYVAAGVLVAAGLAAAAALLAERTRPRVRRAADLAALVPYPVAGRVPRTRLAKPYLPAAMSDPAVADAVRSMRTLLDSDLRGHPLNVIGITSPEAEAGKTTIAASLAVAIAGLDVRVLLVDADLRRPRLGEALGVTASPTLVDAMRGDATWRAAVRPGPRHGVHVIPAERSDDSADLVARRLGPLLAEMREEYDVVVLDCPPLLGADEAATIATLVDGVLLVVPVGSSHAAVRDAAAILGRVSATVVGTVLNGDRARSRTGAY